MGNRSGDEERKGGSEKVKSFSKSGKSRSDSLLFPYAKRSSLSPPFGQVQEMCELLLRKKTLKNGFFSHDHFQIKCCSFQKHLFLSFSGMAYCTDREAMNECDAWWQCARIFPPPKVERRRRLRRQLSCSSERDFSLPISAESAKSNSGKTRAAKREERRKKRGSAILFFLCGEALRGDSARLKAFYRGALSPIAPYYFAAVWARTFWVVKKGIGPHFLPSLQCPHKWYKKMSFEISVA